MVKNTGMASELKPFLHHWHLLHQTLALQCWLRSCLHLCSCYQEFTITMSVLPSLVVHTVLWPVVTQQLLLLFCFDFGGAEGAHWLTGQRQILPQQDVYFLITSSKASGHIHSHIYNHGELFLLKQPTGRSSACVLNFSAGGKLCE